MLTYKKPPILEQRKRLRIVFLPAAPRFSINTNIQQQRPVWRETIDTNDSSWWLRSSILTYLNVVRLEVLTLLLKSLLLSNRNCKDFSFFSRVAQGLESLWSLPSYWNGCHVSSKHKDKQTAVSCRPSAVPLPDLFKTRESAQELGWPVPAREQSDSEPP